MSNDDFSEEEERHLGEVFDELSEVVIHSDLTKVVPLVQERGIQITASSLAYLRSRCVDPRGPFGTPMPIIRFYRKLVEAHKATTILNPWGEEGTLGAYIADRLSPQRVDIITSDYRSKELIEPLGLQNVHLHLGSIPKTEGSLLKQYDAIIFTPPVGLKKIEYTVQRGSDQIELLDSPPSLVAAVMANRLKPGGFMALGVPSSFVWDTGKKSVRRNLEKLGLHLSALLEHQVNQWYGLGPTLYMAILVQEEQSDVFVARIPDEADAQRQLLDRLLKRKNAPMPSMGRLVSLDCFFGLESLEARERYTRLAKSTGRPVSFTAAVPAVKSPLRKGSEFARCEEHPHAVYLPEMAMTKATTRQSELPPKLKSYYQLIVDPSKVQPDYLAQYLNTPIGHAWRQSVMTGATIPRINRTLMGGSRFYLPTRLSQEESVLATREIRRMLTELKELEERLWEEPEQISKTVEAVRSFNNEERFKDWVETLPFPLASILRSYSTVDLSPKQKYERLLFFFEAFTAFSAMVHISALRSNDLLWRPQRDALLEKLNEQEINLDKASFGTWRVIMESMASKLRSMLANPEEAPLACNLYAVANPTPLGLFTSAELLKLLQHANYLRNKWPGHGGSVAQADAEERLNLLEQDIGTFREIVGRRFLQYQLIEPQESWILKGPVYRYHIRRFVGSNPQLEHDKIDLTVPATSGCLYMHHVGHDKVLDLIPIVQVVDTPQPASYFYSNVDNGQAHLVSYHLSENAVSPNPSQLAVPSTSLRALFKELKLTSNPALTGAEQ